MTGQKLYEMWDEGSGSWADLSLDCQKRWKNLAQKVTELIDEAAEIAMRDCEERR